MPVAIWFYYNCTLRQWQVRCKPNCVDKQSSTDRDGPDCAETHFDPIHQRPHVLGSEEHALSDSSLEEIHTLREQAVREDIARRLSGVCSNFSADEFQKLVATMADRQCKRERRLTW